MDIDYMHGRFEMIFTESMIDRMRLLTSLDGEVEKIIVDVHGLTCKEAERFINNIVNITRGCCVVEVIHGYRHGTRIKEMLRQRFRNPIIKEIVGDQWNLGVTYLQPA